jgi:outer membrane protein, heavy metal efflux system
MKKFMALIMVSGFAIAVFPQDKLLELWNLSIEKNPSVTAEKMELRALEEEAKAAGLLPDPTLEIEMMSIDPSGLNSNKGYSAGISQTIPSKGKLSLEKERAEAKIEIQKAVIRDKEYELGRDISEAFWEAQLLRRLLGINGRRLSSVGAVKSSALALYSANAISLVDLLRIEEETTRLSAENRDLSAKMEMKKAELSALAGEDIPAELASESEFDNNYKFISDTDICKIIDSSPALLVAKKRVDLADVEERMARKAKNPDFMVKGVYKIDDPGMNGKDSISLMMGLTLPFLRTKSRYDPMIEKAVYEKKREEEMLNYEKTGLQSGIRSLQEELKKDIEIIQLYEKLEIQAESAFQSSISMYASGKGDLNTLFDTLDGYYSAQEMSCGAKAAFSAAKTKLECYLGILEIHQGA